jgi:hypothetical protein
MAKLRIVRFPLPLYYFVLDMAKYSPKHCVLIHGRTLSSLYDKRSSLRPTVRKVILSPVSLLFVCAEIGKQTILNWLVARILHIQSSLNLSVNVILCFTLIPKYWSFAIFSPSLLANCINVLSCIPVTVNEHKFSYTHILFIYSAPFVLDLSTLYYTKPLHFEHSESLHEAIWDSSICQKYIFRIT